VTSSRRYKENIVDMGGESDALMRLRPVAFRYRPEYDETGPGSTGWWRRRWRRWHRSSWSSTPRAGPRPCATTS
jgi:hypothetical protein